MKIAETEKLHQAEIQKKITEETKAASQNLQETIAQNKKKA